MVRWNRTPMESSGQSRTSIPLGSIVLPFHLYRQRNKSRWSYHDKACERGPCRMKCELLRWCGQLVIARCTHILCSACKLSSLQCNQWVKSISVDCTPLGFSSLCRHLCVSWFLFSDGRMSNRIRTKKNNQYGKFLSSGDRKFILMIGFFT